MRVESSTRIGGRPFTEQEDEEILAAYRAGEMMKPVAMRLGRAYETVRGRLKRILDRLGEPPPQPLWVKWLPEENVQASKLHSEGVPYAEIAQRLGKSSRAIRWKMQDIREGRVSVPVLKKEKPIPVEESVYSKMVKAAQNKAIRKCLRCQKNFESTHAGNRICVRCASENRMLGLPTWMESADLI